MLILVLDQSINYIYIRVWSEPEMIEECKNEFCEVTEKYLETAEKLFGKYRWGKYDLLVMPPAFPVYNYNLVWWNGKSIINICNTKYY